MKITKPNAYVLKTYIPKNAIKIFILKKEVLKNFSKEGFSKYVYKMLKKTKINSLFLIFRIWRKKIQFK